MFLKRRRFLQLAGIGGLGSAVLNPLVGEAFGVCSEEVATCNGQHLVIESGLAMGAVTNLAEAGAISFLEVRSNGQRHEEWRLVQAELGEVDDRVVKRFPPIGGIRLGWVPDNVGPDSPLTREYVRRAFHTLAKGKPFLGEHMSWEAFVAWPDVADQQHVLSSTMVDREVYVEGGGGRRVAKELHAFRQNIRDRGRRFMVAAGFDVDDPPSDVQLVTVVRRPLEFHVFVENGSQIVRMSATCDHWVVRGRVESNTVVSRTGKFPITGMSDQQFEQLRSLGCDLSTGELMR